MKSLIITAHPSSRGKTHLIAERYGKSAKRRGYEVETLDLYKTEYQLPFFSFEDLRSNQAHPNVKPLQDKITAADEIVFIHPIWWGNMPAISKNFIDHVFASHFAFKYNEHGKPVGLLKGKTARVFLTAGTPRPLAWFAYEFFFSPLQFIWKIFILNHCGLKVSSFMVLPGCNAKGFCDDHLNKFLDRVENI